MGLLKLVNHDSIHQLSTLAARKDGQITLREVLAIS